MYKIRPGKFEDLKDVNMAHARSIREICIKDYSPEQIEGWSAIIYDPVRFKNTVENEIYYIAEWNGKIEGFCHAKNNEDDSAEIMGLYITPTIIGKGIGREMLNLALEELYKFSPKKIVIAGSITAKPFYEKMGFTQSGPVQLHKTRGISFEYIPMEKIIKRDQ